MLPEFEKILDASFDDALMDAKDLPNIALYMDQVLTLLDGVLAKDKRRPDEVLLTKTMVNNYSKERLILPVKGKKYTREQIMQILCILNLKQNLTLSDVHTLVACDGEKEKLRFETVYMHALQMKQRLRPQLRALAEQAQKDGCLKELVAREQMLALSLVFSSAATYMRRICEKMLDSAALQADGKTGKQAKRG